MALMGPLLSPLLLTEVVNLTMMTKLPIIAHFPPCFATYFQHISGSCLKCLCQVKQHRYPRMAEFRFLFIVVLLWYQVGHHIFWIFLICCIAVVYLYNTFPKHHVFSYFSQDFLHILVYPSPYNAFPIYTRKLQNHYNLYIAGSQLFRLVFMITMGIQFLYITESN